ncbi:MAG TPA: TonB-dependent receptor, partial [Pyrinomonadaceae bacterium]|nr:TonB-dependent receptor [Pyrinomonadaceae bacterium]
MKIALRFFVLCLTLASTAAAVTAQERLTTGSIGGTVVDPNGAAIAGATVTASGALTTRATNTDGNGAFEISNLPLGGYTVTVEQQGFKKATVTNVQVNVSQRTALRIPLETGDISVSVDVTAAAAAVDQSSTAVGQNLSDQLFSQIPVQRGVVGLFYLSPGAADSLGGGAANPSIAGGSALDNLYIADGVNITDSAFGGLGTFSRVYGSLGTGINTSFIKEVQVKTGGFEPQYGQSQGGIINIITQSGGNEYHGAIYGFARPDAFEATRKQRDDFSVNKVGKVLAEEQYDAGVDFGGYVPGLRDKLFFFGSFNPSVRRQISRGAEGSGLLSLLGDHARRYRTLNYAFKTDYNINSNHTVAFSIFGDPTKTNKSSFNTLNIDNPSAQSVLDFGTRNIALRYNGALTPTWSFSSSFSQGKNTFNETGFDDIFQVTDLTQTGGLPGQRGSFRAQGLGFFEPTESITYRYTADTSKSFTFLGSHTVGLGYQYQRAEYSGVRDRSGPKSPIPAANATGQATSTLISAAAASAIGAPSNNAFSLRIVPAALRDGNPANGECTLCPFLNIPGLGDRRVYLLNDRGEYGDTSFTTRSNYHAAYIQDTWR